MDEVSFGSLDAANAARTEYSEHLCTDDDRRLKTVRFSSDTPEGVRDVVRAQAMESRSLEDRRSQTSDLSQGEIEKIKRSDGFAGPATTFSWESAKGVFAREGEMSHFSDAIGSIADYEDPIEGAEAWIGKFRESGGSLGSKRDVGDEDIRQQQRAEKAAKAAQGGQCDHATGHCRHGDPDACEFLREACGYSEDEVEELLGAAEEDVDTTEEITGEAAGALKRAWGGYKGAVSAVDESLSEWLSPNWEQAQQSAKAINAIRRQHGQEPMDFERLEELQARVQDFARRMAADCHECHVDHSDHDHAGGREVLDEDQDVVDVDGDQDVVDVDEDQAGADPAEAIEQDPQRDLAGERVDEQTTFAGGEEGRRRQGEVETLADVDRNSGGIMADRREGGLPDEEETEQKVPEGFRVAEGGQETL